ncbi:MAG: 4'-phosphopantetheinyl transferase superfamily protein [Flavipsychrobacter sp.]|nr:4'-phosphopantetheinyl transferase superfamily protein [Flavipsychrobacter sp.]
MPLYREWSVGHDSLAAIWKIDEPESFFVARTGVQPDIKNEKRRMEHLAGRFLLKHLKEDFPVLNIRPDDHDKPRIADNQYFFSISHSWPYVAAIVSPYHECGIDLQVWHERMTLLQHKYLSATEQALFNNDPKMLTMAWSAKEAAYKWQGMRGVEFIDHLVIESISAFPEKYYITIILNLMNPNRVLTVESHIEPYFSCAYVVDSQMIP